MEKGLLHVYCGDGKGKTTAAFGLGLRALGRGKRVLCAQFLKSGQSGEVLAIQKTAHFHALQNPPQVPFTFQMTEQERAKYRTFFDHMLHCVEDEMSNYDMIILDELCAALSSEMVDKDFALALLDKARGKVEVVITGRDPLKEVLERADYISRIEMVRHPYTRGVPAREGVEY